MVTKKHDFHDCCSCFLVYLSRMGQSSQYETISTLLQSCRHGTTSLQFFESTQIKRMSTNDRRFWMNWENLMITIVIILTNLKQFVLKRNRLRQSKNYEDVTLEDMVATTTTTRPRLQSPPQIYQTPPARHATLKQQQKTRTTNNTTTPSTTTHHHHRYHPHLLVCHESHTSTAIRTISRPPGSSHYPAEENTKTYDFLYKIKGKCFHARIKPSCKKSTNETYSKTF